MRLTSKLFALFFALLTIGGVAAYGVADYISNPRRSSPFVYSENALLLELWSNYKSENIEPGSFRTLDKSQQNITTSEGQSYTMLRAVWMDDKATFDRSWSFSKNNLQRQTDKLLSWKFGLKSDGSYGILTDIGGQNTASDGDVDTAHALMMAYSRWNEPSYLYEAKQIVSGIWKQEVVTINGLPVLAANDLEKNNTGSIVVNPSYFAPYAFKLFSKIDPANDWMGLASNSYTILNDLSYANLGGKPGSGLPPNWITMNRQTGEFVANVSPNLDTRYGYDALRIPFRMALDYTWNKDPRAKDVLDNFSFLSDQWKKDGKIRAVYEHDGTIYEDYETPAMYGGVIGYFDVIEPDTAKDVYSKKLQTLYSPDRQQWQIKLSYYDDNWAWFGIALHEGALPNLATINN